MHMLPVYPSLTQSLPTHLSSRLGPTLLCVMCPGMIPRDCLHAKRFEPKDAFDARTSRKRKTDLMAPHPTLSARQEARHSGEEAPVFARLDFHGTSKRIIWPPGPRFTPRCMKNKYKRNGRSCHRFCNEMYKGHKKAERLRFLNGEATDATDKRDACVCIVATGQQTRRTNIERDFYRYETNKGCV